MLIRIEHATAYAYSQPLLASTQYVRLTPLSGSTQAVEAWWLQCPGALVTEWRDHYGNLCHTLTLPAPLDALEIKVSGLVRTRETHGVFGLAQSELPPALYLRETPYTLCTPAIRNYASGFKALLKKDRIEGLHAIMLAIAGDVSYSPGDTHVHTTAAEALEQRSGVCQDHAHIFCAICRSLGVPARYVSGYLAASENHEAHAAGHAWAEALVDDLGWVAFDPTNRACADESYVRTAIGLDYAEAAPVRGVRNGGGEEVMRVAVSFAGQQ